MKIKKISYKDIEKFGFLGMANLLKIPNWLLDVE